MMRRSIQEGSGTEVRQVQNNFMIGASIAYNLKKWMNYQERYRKTAIMRLKRAENAFIFWLLELRHSIVHASTKHQNLNHAY